MEMKGMKGKGTEGAGVEPDREQRGARAWGTSDHW